MFIFNQGIGHSCSLRVIIGVTTKQVARHTHRASILGIAWREKHQVEAQEPMSGVQARL